ncbi:conserved hypothetical protein [Vibrio nigripulchritudo MADA3029]|uniref:hypothetical protein n=1 Tax=Vibrio nigripulchritudo TaxID=28173 RepID=UPI0003B1DE4C|nr:hypothetical protein [Vibrio nigripulchritudo]CCN47676.1 conserved hypothetical protein [Vibrio nigripulchritudo MADA3020]CCN55160.1 conserved hypothetical protein [Vibrio nigripulchritudo MADA3021]CCN58743.1 conserved hypothetical protein [Vibrio nigripulchritudo MADA3029]
MKTSITLLAVLGMTSFSVNAGEQTGKVATLYARAADNLHLVTLTGGSAKTNSPACATQEYWLIRDEQSTTGKSQFSQLLAAKMSGKSVAISGLNTCSRWGDGEDINTIVILD